MTSSIDLKQKMASTGNFLMAELDISTKLSNLEERASKLELEFSEMMSAARELANIVKRCADKAETETRVSQTEASFIAKYRLNYCKIFENFHNPVQNNIYLLSVNVDQYLKANNN